MNVPQAPHVSKLNKVSASEYRRSCVMRAGGVRPKKSLGQNFLANKHILRQIADAAKLAPGQVVLEVGPGTGNLTRCLLDQGASVTAVEKDRRLIKRLANEFPQVNVIEADILTCDLEALLFDLLQPQGASGTQRVKVIGNLPYYITQDFLRQLLPLGLLVSNAVLLLQEEAALRLTQLQPGAFDYRAASLEIQYYSEARCLFTIPKSEFSPVPDVNGMVVDFALHLPEDRVVSDAGSFLSLVRQAFSMKRKMLRNSLQPLYSLPQITQALTVAGLSAQVRPQQLSLHEYAKLYEALHA